MPGYDELQYTSEIMGEYVLLPWRRKKLALRAGTGPRHVIAAVVLAFLVTCSLPGQARPSQYDVEAAYLLDFGKFLRSSGESQALRRTTFDVCIVGHDSLGRSIDRLAANEAIDGREVRVLRGVAPLQARTCAIAFIPDGDDEAIREDLRVFSGRDVLTVSDAPHFLNNGGMIQFVLQKDHVRFAVNLDALRKTRLVLSSQLIRVALYVIGHPVVEGKP